MTTAPIAACRAPFLPRDGRCAQGRSVTDWLALLDAGCSQRITCAVIARPKLNRPADVLADTSVREMA